jgi:hypothetical protein
MRSVPRLSYEDANSTSAFRVHMRSSNVPRQISVVPARVAMAAPKTKKMSIANMPRGDPFATRNAVRFTT